MAQSEPIGGDRDNAAVLVELSQRLGEAEGYLNIADARARKLDLEAQAAKPDLWDDQDQARAVTTELGRVSDDVNRFDRLSESLGDAEVALEMISDAKAAGESDPGLEAELAHSLTALERELGGLEVQSLFQGEYDEYDAIAEVHAGAGGTDAQDWAEMMLRMYSRWAERRGFDVEVDEI